jgi:hypothetical protein
MTGERRAFWATLDYHRSGSGQCGAKSAGQQQASATVKAVHAAAATTKKASTKANVEPCSHGLLFHPGCTD